MQALADELGVQIYDQFEDGETTYEFAGAARRRLPRQVRCRADRPRTGAP